MMKITYINEMTGETVVEWMKVEEQETVTDRTVYTLKAYNAKGVLVATMISKNYDRGLKKMLSKIDDPNSWYSYKQIVKIDCEERVRPDGKFFFEYNDEFTLWERETEELKSWEEETPATGEAAIDQFLATYKEKAFLFYDELATQYREIKNKEYEITAENLACIPANVWGGQKYSNEQIEKIMSGLNEMPEFKIKSLKMAITRSKFKTWLKFYTKSNIAVVEKIAFYRDLEKRNSILAAIIDKDVQTKKENIYKLVEAKAGKIIDAKFLRVGIDGDLNGRIVGDKETVNVTSFSAGGENIQKYHYRLKVTVTK
jgi:hypothetical protein